MGGTAWVTLATNDSYALGALVVANSLKRVNTVHDLAILITPGVTLAMKNELIKIFNFVKEVDVFDSRDETNLRLLSRPDLGITFTKIHAWRLTQYSKCVFLDADVLIVQNCDELFERDELSAAPDAGWPDCFNSGVFVFKPSDSTYNALVEFALVNGSFDGGDQGLLNLYFSDWATADSSKRLPFLYNMCSTSTYSYLPALKQFGSKVKIIHFIGSSKPWLQHFDPTTRTILSGDSHLCNFLQLWWDVFVVHVHPTLSTEMGGLARALAQVPIGTPISAEQLAYEDHMHRQHWEEGHIDYLGKDSWDNIWKKISQTIEPAKPAAVDPSPPLSQPTAESKDSPVPTVSEIKPAAGTEPLPVTSEAPSPFVPTVVPSVPSTPPVDSAGSQASPGETDTTALVATSVAPDPYSVQVPTAPVSTPVKAPVAPVELPAATPAPALVSPTVPISTQSPIASEEPSVKHTDSPVAPIEQPATPTELSSPATSTAAIPSTPPVESPVTLPPTPAASPSAQISVLPVTTAPVETPIVTPTVTNVASATAMPVATSAATPAAASEVVATPVAASEVLTTPVAASEVTAPSESAPSSAVSAAIASAVTMAAAPAVCPAQPTSTTQVTPSTPTVTCPTPPQSPLSDIASKLEKLDMDPSIAETPSTTSSEPPVPPKRKGSKDSQGKGGKGKK